MTRFRLNRRDVLRGMGSIAVALPWLEAMAPLKGAQAQSPGAAKRFMAVYQPGGTVLDRWRPTGSESDFVLSPILQPLEAVREKLLILDGLNLQSAQGEQHQAGIVALLTGIPQRTANQFPAAGGPSVDQVIAANASQGLPRASIEVAVRWATGKSHGLLHPINSLTFDLNGDPVPPRLDPNEIYSSLFGGLNPDAADRGTAALLARKRSILDFLDRRYDTLAARLGAFDRSKLQEHLTRIREIEQSLAAVSNQAGGSCEAPELVDTSDYDPQSGLNSSDDGSVKDGSSDAAIPKVGKLMMDMLVMALACDLTGVVTLQWSDTEAKHTFPWLNLSEHHHYYQHDGGFRPAECEKICHWYSEQHTYLLQQMDSIAMSENHTLLDESVVFFGSELSDPPTHTKNDMPFLLAGGGGNLRGGRYLRYGGRSHNDLLAAIVNLFGDTRTTFGDPRHATSALTELT